MSQHPDDQPSFITDQPSVNSGETQEIGRPGRSPLQLLGIGALAVALGWLVITSNTSDDAALPTTTVPDSAPAPTPVPPVPDELTPTVGDPRVVGTLRNDRRFEVYEDSPGVLCVTFPDEPADSDVSDTCHLELESASGAGVIDNLLVFGYLVSGTESASVRYRSGEPSNAGMRLEPTARFFALPLRADDAYRLQYRDSDYTVASEVPLVALRGGPSQSPEDAARDDVPDEIAELPFNRRLDVVAEWTTFPEGPMVFSQQPTMLATQPGWGELLLLDPTGTRIERSTPIPSLRLTAQLSRPDAHYFLGQQITTPGQITVDRDEMHFPVALVRIDRATGEHLIRLFPQAATADEGSQEPDISPIIGRPGWELGPELPAIDVSSIGGIDDVLRLKATDGSTIQLDGGTLLPS